jgi:Glycosyltransferase family 87
VRRLGPLVACVAVQALYGWLVVVPACLHWQTNGFAAYYTEARVLYRQPGDFARVYQRDWFQARIDELGFGVKDEIGPQPPQSGLMMLPVAWLSPRPARVAWVLLGWALGLGAVVLVAAALSVRAAAAVAMAPLYLPLAENLRQGQCYALMLFLFAAALALALRSPKGERTLAGLFLAAMTLLKGSFLWTWPALAGARRWRILAGGLAAAATVVLITAPVMGWAAWRACLRDLHALALDPGRYVTAYQTLTSLFGHLFVRDARWNPAPIADLPWLAQLLTAGALVLVLAATVRVQRLGSQRLDERALSWALLAPAAIVLAPVAEGYHYLLLLPSLVIAAWWAWCGRAGARAWIWLGACALALEAPYRFYGARVLGERWLALLAYPRVYGAIGLWLWLARQIRRRPVER